MLCNKWLLISVAFLRHGSAGQLPVVLCIFMGPIQELCSSFGTQVEGSSGHWSMIFSGHETGGQESRQMTHRHTHTWSCLSDVEYVKSIVFHCLRQLTRPNSTSEEQRSFSGHSEARLGEERKKNRYYYHRGDRAWAWVTAGHFSGETHDCHFWEVLLNNFIHDFLCSAFFILDF